MHKDVYECSTGAPRCCLVCRAFQFTCCYEGFMWVMWSVLEITGSRIRVFVRSRILW